MKIYFAFQCHNFQRRTCWMLSSILQQTIWPFDIVIDIACLRGNGYPSTEEVAGSFQSKGMDVRLTYIDDRDIFARRGLVRNIQTQNAINDKSDYIFYTDADNVYHPDFFKILVEKLEKQGNQIDNCIYSCNKMHTIKEATDIVLMDTIGELPFIDKAFERALSIPMLIIEKDKIKNGAAPGCMQVVAIKDMIEKCNGIYCDLPDKDQHLFNQGQKAWSDMHFRGRIGQSTKIRLPLYIHLQHTRDKEVGKHIEEQR